MARVNIEDCWWTDPRRTALQRLGVDADGVSARAWKLAQDFWKHGRKLVPLALFQTLEGAEALIQVGLAEVQGSFVYVRGSSAYLDWVAEKREQAKAAGKKSAEVRRKKKGTAQPKPRTKPERTPNEPRTEFNDAEPSVSGSFSDSVSDSGSCSGSVENTIGGLEEKKREPASRGVWRAYREAYLARYRVEPTPNAMVWGQLKQFVSRVPQAEAPDIARFYLTHPDWYYVKNRHPVGALLKDAEKLRTEWLSGVKATGTQARQEERFDSNVQVAREYFAETEGGQ